MKLLRQFKAMPESVKATVVFGVASFATSGINYIMTPVFTRLLSTAEYGVINIYNSWHSIIQVIAAMTLIYPGVLHVGLYEHSDNRWRYLSTMMGIITTVSGAMLALYLLFAREIDKFISLPPSLMLLNMITCMILPATTLWTTKQRYEYKYRITFFVVVGAAAAAQLVSVLAVLAARGRGVNLAVVRLWSAGLTNLTVGLVLYCFIFFKGRTFFDRALWQETFRVTIPLIPHYLSSVVLTGTDKIMIGKMVGESEAGVYGLAAVLSSIGVLFWRALAVTFNPFINARLGQRAFKEIGRAVKPLWVTVGGACVMGALAAPEIIIVMAKREYLAGINAVPPIVAGIYVHALYDAFSAVSFFHKESVRIMRASVTAAVSNIVLNYICIRQFGYIAAGYTTLAAGLILTGMNYRNVLRIEKETIYDGRFVWLSIAAVVLACLGCTLLYGLPWPVRYALIALLAGALYSKRGVLFTTLSKMKV